MIRDLKMDIKKEVGKRIRIFLRDKNISLVRLFVMMKLR